jgi:hypothetical protein
MPKRSSPRRKLPSKPLSLRQLKAEMVLKDLTLTKVAKGARIEITLASKILNGRVIDPQKLSALRSLIVSAAIPGEVAA